MWHLRASAWYNLRRLSALSASPLATIVPKIQANRAHFRPAIPGTWLNAVLTLGLHW